MKDGRIEEAWQGDQPPSPGPSTNDAEAYRHPGWEGLELSTRITLERFEWLNDYALDSILSNWHLPVMSTEAALTELILETFRLNGRLLAAGDALVGDLNLTSARWQVIGAIALSPVPFPVAHLARNMGLTRQGVQRIANELEAEGLVRFAPNSHHQRAKLVLLTDQGRAVYEEAQKRQRPWARSLADGLPVDAINGAKAVLTALRQKLEAGEKQ